MGIMKSKDREIELTHDLLARIQFIMALTLRKCVKVPKFAIKKIQMTQWEKWV